MHMVYGPVVDYENTIIGNYTTPMNKQNAGMHSKKEFVGLTVMFVMWGLLCQGLAFIHRKHLLSCQNCTLECY